MIIVVGAGRSGTNLVLEMLAGNTFFNPSDPPEDKMVFYKANLPQNYLCKCDTIYFSWSAFSRFLQTSQYCNIIWTIRNPKDMILSKMYRGYGHADDASPMGCVGDIFYMFGLYKLAESRFNTRMMLVKMEDVILDIEKEAKEICRWYGIKYEESMNYPHLRMRHKGKKERYKTLDKEQIDLWEHWDTLYDGFFVKNSINVEQLFREVEPITKYFGYK